MKAKKFKKKNLSKITVTTCFGIALFGVGEGINAADILKEQSASAEFHKDYSFSEIVTESVTGDVYSAAAAENWQDLSYSDLFSKGWDKPWVSPPNGGGGAPRPMLLT